MVVDRKVLLPGEMIREVKAARRVAHGELVQPAVAQANQPDWGQDLQRVRSKHAPKLVIC